MSSLMRTRSRGSISNQIGGSTLITYCNGTTSAGSNYGLGYSLGSTQVLTDFVAPDFAQRIARGEIINHPMHSMKVEYGGVNTCSYAITYTPTCSGASTKKQEGTLHRRNLTPNLNLCPYADPSDALSQARVLAGTAAVAGIVEPDFSGLLFAAELDKTFRTFGTPLGNLKKLFTDIRNSNRYKRSRATSLGNFLSAEWLRYRYGILTTLWDLEDLCKLANKPLRPTRQTSRGKSEFVIEPSAYITSYDDGYFGGSFTYTTLLKGGAYAGVLYEHDMTLQDRFGYSLTAIPSVAWELVPYSFVADWLVNFNHWIDALTPKGRVRVLAQWTTTRVETREMCIASAVPKSVPNHSITGKLYIESWRTSKDVIRVPTVDVGLAHRLYEFDLGRAKWQNRIADASALLIQMLSRR